MGIHHTTPQKFDMGTVSTSSRLSGVDIYDHGVLKYVKNTQGAAGPLDVKSNASMMLHIRVTNSSTFTGNLSAFVYAWFDWLKETPITLTGVKYDAGASDVALSGDGEYILDITATAAGFIDPYIEVTTGSADIELFFVAKSV